MARGYEANFVQELQKRHKCPQCTYALRSPMQTECGHLFCNSCLEPILNRPRPLCPVDHESISRDTTFPDNACKREVLTLLVYCKFKPDCEWKGQLKKLEAHIEDCIHRSIQCTLCGRLISYPKLEQHQRQDCPMRPFTCQYCHERVPVEQLPAHIEKVCPAVSRKCPNKCDESKTYKLHELEKHLSFKEGDCPLQEIDCPYVRLGCVFKSVRSEIRVHLEERSVYHATLHVDAIMSVTSKCEEQIRSHNEMMSRFEVVENRDFSFERKQKELSARVEAEEIKSQSKFERLTLRVSTLEDKVTRFLANEKSLQTQQPTLISSPYYSATGGAAVGGLNSMSSLQKLDSLQGKMSEIDNTLTQCITNSMDFDVRLQFMERSSYDGTMLWKIDNLTQHRQEAIEGITLSLYSVPFYTHRQGYKMCARIYLNGDGLGKGTHLSLFFVIMKGNNDALLTWPFEQKVTLVLLNQYQKKNIYDQFRPDPQSSSFQRPIKREMNIASGCPRFCRLDQLKDGFIKDDAIFVGLIVDKTNLKPPVSP